MNVFPDIQPEWILWAFIPIMVAALLISIYIYSRTKPAIPSPYRFLLIGLRSLTLTLVAILIFHPLAEKKEIVNRYPGITFWIDKSLSVNRWMNPETIDEKVQSISKTFSDSISVEYRYFDSNVSDKRDTTSQSGTQTVFNPVVQSALGGFNIVISDGRFDDQDWLFQQPAGIWQAWILGDTTQPAGFSFLPGMNREVTGFVGDTIRVPVGLSWNDIPSDSLLLTWNFPSAPNSEFIRLDNQWGSRVVFIPVFADSAGIKKITFTLRAPGSKETKRQVSTIRVLERYRSVWIVSHQPDALIGFLKRQLNNIGSFDVRITIDAESPGGNQWRTGPTDSFRGLVVAVDYPSKNGKYASVFRKLSETNPVIVLSGKPLLSTLKPGWIPGNTILPPELSNQPWTFLPASSYQLIWSRFNSHRLSDMPPPTEPLVSVPSFSNPQSVLSIAGKEFTFPTSWVSLSVPKRLWMAKANFDDWDRFEATNGKVPSGISVMWQALLKELLTPESQKPVNVTISPVPGTQEIDFVIASDKRITELSPDSLSGILTIDGRQTSLPEANADGAITKRLLVPGEKPFSWMVTLQAPDGRQFTEKGVFNPVQQQTDKNVTYAATEPLRSWLAAYGGIVKTGLPDFEIIRDELEKHVEKEVRSVVLDSWNLVGIFLLILILLTTEWILRKRLGAL